MDVNHLVNFKFKSEQQKALINISYTANFLSNLHNRFISCYDLTMPQFNILRILRGAESALTINTVKERMIEKSPNTTRLIHKLVDKNFIERKGCKEDRRQSYIQITSEGLSILEQIDNRNFEALLNPTSFSEQDAEHLSRLLEKFRLTFNKI